MLGTTERALGIDDPFAAAGGPHQAGKGPRFGLLNKFSMELEFVFGVEVLEAIAVFCRENHRKGAHGKEVAGLDPAPVLAIGSKSPTSDDAMKVVVVEKVLPPCVQDGANPRSHPKFVVCELQKGGAGTFEKQGMKGSLILQNERVKRMGNGENNMEVRHGKKILLLPLQPLMGVGSLTVWTMAVPTRVRHKVIPPAVRTLIVMHAKRRRATA